jgi:hypothetical protein
MQNENFGSSEDSGNLAGGKTKQTGFEVQSSGC